MPYTSAITAKAVIPYREEVIIINGIRRRDCRVITLTLTSGFLAGQASLLFPESTIDESPVSDGDEVVIYLDKKNYPNPFFRGLITSRNATITGGVEYVCLDLRSTLNDTFFTKDYNVPDDMTQEVIETKTLKTHVLFDAYNIHWAHHESQVEALMGMDFSLMPDNYVGEQLLRGVPLGAGMQQVIDDAGNNRWKLKMIYFPTYSRLTAFQIGDWDLATESQIIWGESPARGIKDQPAGAANVGLLNITSGQSTLENHIVVEGARRIVEIAVELTGVWDATKQERLLNNYKRYSEKEASKVEIFDEDTKKFIINEEAKGINPYYDPEVNLIGRHYAIPQIIDTWVIGEGEDAVTHGRTRHPKVMSKVVQKFFVQDRSENDLDSPPFIVYKYDGDENYRYMFEGFFVKNNKTLVFIKPLLRSDISMIENSGKNGSVSSATVYNFSGDIESDVYESGDLIDYYLMISNKKVAFKITGNTPTTVTVTANSRVSALTDASAEFLIYKDNPIQTSGTGGVGDEDGNYTVSGATWTPNAYSGMSLITGTQFAIGDDEEGKNTQATAFRIKYNTDTKLFLTTTDDLSNYSASWQIVTNETVKREFPSEIWLNFAYESEQRLEYDSNKEGTAYKDRKFLIRRNEFKWTTEFENFIISYTDNVLSAEKRATEDVVNTYDDTAMEAWATKRIAFTQELRHGFEVNLPAMDLHYSIGDRIKANEYLTDLNIIEIRYDLVNKTTSLSIANK